MNASRTRSQVSPLCMVIPLALSLAGMGGGAPVAPGAGDEGAGGALAALRAARKELAGRKRRVIFNNDGCDCLYYPRETPLSVDRFLEMRTSPLAGTLVDAIAYCSISSGFSFFTHATGVGTVLDRESARYDIQPEKRNIARELIAIGSDCLKANADFARGHGMEIFWSMRMNDTHDAAHRPDKPYLLFPPLKEQHPDWLVGEPVKRTPVGRWSSVDYGRAEIRDLAFRYIEEVCERYAIDGVELDYFRHPCYFRSVALGGEAGEGERAMMTELMRRVRRMTEEIGLRRGRPILVMVRVPDSVEYNRGLGLDIERWLSEGLIDLLATTCYFRLNPWEYSVGLGHRYGVPVYPCLSDSRVKGETRFLRSSIESYRGRATNAWMAGADGIHIFNLFNPKSQVFREVGDPEKLLSLDKLYFVTVRDGNPDSFLAGGARYRTVPILTPLAGRGVGSGEPLRAAIVIGEDLAGAPARGLKPRLTCHLELPLLRRAEQVDVRFNGKPLGGGAVKGDWLDLPLPAEIVRRGENLVEISKNVGVRLGPDDWTTVYDGDRLPPRPWRRDTGSARTTEALVDGALRIADAGEQSGDYHYWRLPWSAEPGDAVVVEARVKVVSGSSYLIVSNGVADERIGLWPDRVDLWHHRGLRCEMDLTDRFHAVRVEFAGRDLRVAIDGELKIDAAGKFVPRPGPVANQLSFGAANSPQKGEALWDEVKARVNGVSCSDIVVSVKYQRGVASE